VDLSKILIESFEKGGSFATLRKSMAEDPKANPRLVLTCEPDEPVQEFRISVWQFGFRLGSFQQSTRCFRIGPPYDRRILEWTPETFLLGYEPEMNLFAGFNPQQHLSVCLDHFLYALDHCSKAPSAEYVEVEDNILEKAAETGFWVDKSKNGKIVVAFWPEMLPFYTKFAGDIYDYACDEKILEVLQHSLRTRGLPKLKEGMLDPAQTNFVLRITKEHADANFKTRVKRAYNYTCALSGMQLRLIDAAHILRASHEESNDEISNGIVLQPTLHRAMDTRIIYPVYLGYGRYAFRLNRDKACALANKKYGAGIEGLKTIIKYLDKNIPSQRLPEEQNNHPSKIMINKANIDRKIPLGMIHL
jgi:putative restriction endonuclease